MTDTQTLTPEQIARIREIPTRRRLPRQGKIRLGVRKLSKNGKEYPSASEHFVFDPALLDAFPRIQELYADRDGVLAPKELRVMLPSDEINVVFPLRMMRYGKTTGCLCRSTDTTATAAKRTVCGQCLQEECGHKDAPRYLMEVDCPCGYALADGSGRASCSWVGSLMVLLPDVTVGGLFQLDTKSANSITDILSGLELVRQMVGRLRMVPLRLTLVPRDVRPGGVLKTVYTLRISFDGTASDLMAQRQLPAPPSTPAALIEPPHEDGDELEPVLDADPLDEPTNAPAAPPLAGAGAGQAATPQGGQTSRQPQTASAPPQGAEKPGAAQAVGAGPRSLDEIKAKLLASAEAAGVEKKDRFAKVSRVLSNAFNTTKWDALNEEQLAKLEHKAQHNLIDWKSAMLIPEGGNG